MEALQELNLLAVNYTACRRLQIPPNNSQVHQLAETYLMPGCGVKRRATPFMLLSGYAGVIHSR